MRKIIGLSLSLGLALVGGRVSGTDYWDATPIITDNGMGTPNELYHGTSQQHDLQANAGPTADEDWYRVVSQANHSYEAVIDSTSGPLFMVAAAGNFQRLSGTGTVLQTSEPLIPGFSSGGGAALRWEETGGAPFDQFLRAQSFDCGVTCGPNDTYQIRFYETTVSVPRFNNAGGQVTVLIIQNNTDWALARPIAGTAYFRNAAGAPLGSSTFSLVGGQALVLNTATVGGVQGVSGTITVAHDGGYGNLAIKAVALEPATGFSFDSPGLYKPR
jgi:hypothetical protein